MLVYGQHVMREKDEENTQYITRSFLKLTKIKHFFLHQFFYWFISHSSVLSFGIVCASRRSYLNSSTEIYKNISPAAQDTQHVYFTSCGWIYSDQNHFSCNQIALEVEQYHAETISLGYFGSRPSAITGQCSHLTKCAREEDCAGSPLQFSTLNC